MTPEEVAGYDAATRSFFTDSMGWRASDTRVGKELPMKWDNVKWQ